MAAATVGKRHDRLRVGGLKILEGACVASSFPGGGNRPGLRICYPLAQNRINLTLLAHTSGDRGSEKHTFFCTADSAGQESLSLLQALPGHRDEYRLLPGACNFSLFPHDQRPEILGALLRCLARARLAILGLASSPAAITVVLAAGEKDRALETLFACFDFPAYRLPQEFLAAQDGPDKLLREVIAAYQEKVVKIYCIAQQPDLEYWDLAVHPEDLERFGAALVALGDLGWKVPFLVGLPGRGQELLLSCCLDDQGAGGRTDAAPRLLHSQLPGLTAVRQAPVAVVSIHGPHFGDRYGIAATLVTALEEVRVAPLALSCAVSSISAVVRESELATVVQTLGETFEVQTGCF